MQLHGENGKEISYFLCAIFVWFGVIKFNCFLELYDHGWEGTRERSSNIRSVEILRKMGGLFGGVAWFFCYK